MHLLLSLSLASAAPPSTPVPVSDTSSSSATWRERRLSKRSAARHVDFEDPVDVFGEVTEPDIDIILSPPPLAHTPLFKVRQDFNEELEQSTHFVK